MRNAIESKGKDPADFGWASVQLDGGIERVVAKAIDFFKNVAPAPEDKEIAGLDQLRIGFIASSRVSARVSEVFAIIGNRIAAAGGTVVLTSQRDAVALLHRGLGGFVGGQGGALGQRGQGHHTQHGAAGGHVVSP